MPHAGPKLSPSERARAERFMREALVEAAKGQGRTRPNPVVGALVVRGNEVLARGYHRKAGTPHAEAIALRRAGARAKGADLFTTLEPCNHHGRTPPCTDAVLAAGIRRVFFASRDPNPLVNGRGVARLRRAGVQVFGGLLGAEADALNWPFFKVMREGLPWVALKVAVTLDGRLAAQDGSSRWVTGEVAREHVHRLRDRFDAILVGAGTVEADDPALTVRLPKGRDPLRVVLDSGLRTGTGRRVYSQASPAGAVVVTTQPANGPRARPYLRAGCEVWQVAKDPKGVALRPTLERLAARGLSSVLVEGGAEVHTAFLKEGLADELYLYLAPKLLGASAKPWVTALGRDARMADALEGRLLEARPLSGDVLVHVLLRKRLP